MFYFSKMQAIGNDFVIIDDIKNNFEYSFKLLAEFFCDRHYGVGADGIIVVDTSDVADFKMRIFNSDGSEAEMCGNGIRCFAKYVYEKKLTDKEIFQIETLAGIKEVKLTLENERIVSMVEVDMGEPSFDDEKIPVIYLDGRDEKGIKVEENEVYPISMGNPHAVCFVDDVDKVEIEKIGPMIEDYKYFPNKTNVEFVQIIDKKHIKVRVWERGVGETLACGTGACAAMVISHIKKSTESEITVDLPGGKLEITYNKKVILKGSAEFVFEGEIEI